MYSIRKKKKDIFSDVQLFCTIYLPSLHDRYKVKAPKQTKSLVY